MTSSASGQAKKDRRPSISEFVRRSRHAGVRQSDKGVCMFVFFIKKRRTYMSGSINKRSQFLVAMSGLLLFAGARAYGEAKWYDSIAASGYLQTSYVANLNRPNSRVNAGRQFD